MWLFNCSPNLEVIKGLGRSHIEFSEDSCDVLFFDPGLSWVGCLILNTHEQRRAIFAHQRPPLSSEQAKRPSTGAVSGGFPNDTNSYLFQVAASRHEPWHAPSVRTSVSTWLVATWLILPVVICLSQRLSHACLRTYLRTVKLRMAH